MMQSMCQGAAWPYYGSVSGRASDGSDDVTRVKRMHPAKPVWPSAVPTAWYSRHLMGHCACGGRIDTVLHSAHLSGDGTSD